MGAPGPEIKAAKLTISGSRSLPALGPVRTQISEAVPFGSFLSGQLRGAQEPRRAEGSINVHALGEYLYDLLP